MDIYIFRHGKAGKHQGDPADDFKRPLTAKGEKEVRRIARWFLDSFDAPDWIATSPLTRSRETADIMVRELRAKDRLEEWKSLAIGQDPEAVLDQLSKRDPDSCGMIVGHEPQLSECIALMVITGGSARIALAKGGMAKVGQLYFDPDVQGTLEWLVSPELIPGS